MDIDVNQSDSNETLKANNNIETLSSSSSSSIQPLDENSKLSELNLNSVQQDQIMQQEEDGNDAERKEQQTVEKRDEIMKETFLTENFQQFFQPLIQNLDSNVSSLRTSQIELGTQIDLLASQMKVINENLQKQIDLDEYSKRLLAAKKRVNGVLATILSVEERMGRIYSQVKKDAALQQQQAAVESKK